MEIGDMWTAVKHQSVGPKRWINAVRNGGAMTYVAHGRYEGRRVQINLAICILMSSVGIHQKPF